MKVILHSDVNNFFASVECVTRPELKDKPVAVTGNPEKRNGVILAKNDLAKKFGVKTGEVIWEAKQKCPDLICLAPHYNLYEKISKELHDLYLDYTDFVEPLGLDECFLDVTNSLKYLKMTGEEIANEIRMRVKKEFGFTVSVGVSFSKIFAKLGSDMKKPDATTIISKENFKEITYPLPLNSIIGIGGKLWRKFENMNILTIGEFVNLDESIIKTIMGKTGLELQSKLKGELIEPVACSLLCEKIALRMTRGKFEARTIAVTIKTNEFEKFRHSKTVAPIKSYERIFECAMELLDSFWQYEKKIRAIRVRVSSLNKVEEYRQLSIFDDEKIKLTECVEEIKSKYGENKIFIASTKNDFLNYDKFNDLS